MKLNLKIPYIQVKILIKIDKHHLKRNVLKTSLRRSYIKGILKVKQ